MSELKDLNEIFDSPTIKPSFEKVHVLLALIIIEDEDKGIGRYRLKRMLNLSEGKVKTLLERMKKFNLIEKESRIIGHTISKKGKNLLKELFQYITKPIKPKFDYSQLTLGEFAYYSILRQSADKISSGMEQRDEAIKIGATGATCFIYKNNTFHFPDKKDINVALNKNEIDYEINDFDVLVIGTGSNENIARLATLKVAIKTLNI